MERAASQELYDRYAYAVHQRCLRLLGSRAEADDALQEVFLRVMRHDSQEAIDSPLAWLYRIADRHCFDVFRKRKRLASPEESRRALEAWSLQPARARSPDDIRALSDVLGACKPKVQEAAVLYFVDEMTQEEVADTLGVSRKTVRERLEQFLATARKRLAVREVRHGT